MLTNWTINSFNYLDSLENEVKLQIRNQFNEMISYFPLRFSEKEIDGQKVNICSLPKLPFVIVFQLDMQNETCTVLRVFHKRQEKRL